MNYITALVLFLALTGCASFDKKSFKVHPESNEVRDMIRKEMRKNPEEFSKCYSGSPEGKSGTTGRLTFQFVIQKDGRVGSVEPLLEESSLKSPELINCFREVISKKVFPWNMPNTEGQVIFPFRFEGK